MSILDSIEWARETLKNRLMFGMEDAPLQAAFARENRVAGVLMDCIKEIKKMRTKTDKLEQDNKILEKEKKRLLDALSKGIDAALLELQNDPAEHDMYSWLENVAKPTYGFIKNREASHEKA